MRKKIITALLSFMLLMQPMQAFAFTPSVDGAGFFNVTGTVLMTDGQNGDEVGAVAEHYLKIPEPVRALIASQDYRVYVYAGQDENTERNADALSYSSAVRYWEDTGKLAGIDAPAYTLFWTGRGTQHDSLVHEAGHLFDYAYSIIHGFNGTHFGISDRADWHALYSGHAWHIGGYDLNSTANVYNTQEMFAEAFRQYVEDPVSLQERCPESYAFVAGVISEVGKYSESGFDAAAYAAANPDLQAAFGGDVHALYRHYLENGWREHRQGVVFR